MKAQTDNAQIPTDHTKQAHLNNQITRTTPTNRMAPLPALVHTVFHPPSATYDPTCVPQRYKPCPAQLLEQQLGAAKPGGLSPNAVVVLVFFLTLLV